jgi:hypothetical protein
LSFTPGKSSPINPTRSDAQCIVFEPDRLHVPVGELLAHCRIADRWALVEFKTEGSIADAVATSLEGSLTRLVFTVAIYRTDHAKKMIC